MFIVKVSVRDSFNFKQNSNLESLKFSVNFGTHPNTLLPRKSPNPVQQYFPWSSKDGDTRPYSTLQ